MSRAQIDSVLEIHAGRFVADGVDPQDLETILGRISVWDDWYPAWAEVGDRYERLGLEARKHGRLVTAGELLWRACIHYHYAQFLFFQDRETRERGQRKKQELYGLAAPLLVTPAERFDVPVDAVTVPGYLRLPPGRGPFPVVVLLGGLESTKEESYEFENSLLKRGLATCAFDGPGQGEMHFHLPFQPDFERYTSAVIDWLETRPEVTADRIGLLGRSLGGCYAIRSAAADTRIKATVVWGAMYELAPWENLAELTRMGFHYVSGIEREGEARAALAEGIDLTGLLERVRGGLLVLHGARDHLVPAEQAERVSREAVHAEPNNLWVEPEGNHCCHNLSPIIRPAMADWLLERLTAGPS